MKNYSKQSTLRSRNKILAAIAAALLLVVMVGGVVLGIGFGVYGKDTSKWFKPVEQEQVKDPNADNKDDSSLVVNVQDGQEISLLMSSATVASDGSTTQDITATVPVNATINKVNWSVAFANPSSEWATGENVEDYVTIARTGDLSATITCVDAFGEQIIITATAADGGGAKATATCDYVKRVNSFTIDVNGDKFEDIGVHADASILIKCPSRVDDQNNRLNYNIEYSVGTLTPEIVFDYDMCTLSGDALWNIFETQLEAEGFSFTNEKYKNPFASHYFDFERLLTTGIVDTWSFILPEIRTERENDPVIANEMQDFDVYVVSPALYQISKLGSYSAEIELCYDVVYNGTVIQKECYIDFSSVVFDVCSHFIKLASSVSLSSPSFVF